MLDLDTLRDLADFAGPERAFLTVYLDHGDDPSVLEADLGRIRSLLADQPEEMEHFEESLAMTRELLDEFDPQQHGSLAIYTSWAGDLRRAYALPEPVGTKVWMGDAPYLRPAYELIEEHETYAAVVLDNDKARIYLVSADEVDEEGRVRGDVKNRVKKGGWSQKRYARRRDKQIESYATEIAQGLAALEAERPFSRLVLVGSDEPVRAVTDALRQDLKDKLVGSTSVDGNADDSQALEAAAELAVEGEREAEQSLWVQIREQGMGPGLAAFGATSVLEALRQARAEAVLVDREAEIAGTKCRACEHVAHGTPDTCGICGSRDVFRVDLVEVMTEQATRTGAEVDFADPFDALEDVGGVAALLRYSLSKTNPEQEERERREAETPAFKGSALEAEAASVELKEPADVLETEQPTDEPDGLEDAASDHDAPALEPNLAAADETPDLDADEKETSDLEAGPPATEDQTTVLEADPPALEDAGSEPPLETEVETVAAPQPEAARVPKRPTPSVAGRASTDRADPGVSRWVIPAVVLILLVVAALFLLG